MREAFYQRLEDKIRGAAPRRVLILAHHPIQSHGEHGGFVSPDLLLFPGRAWRSWLFLPLPLLYLARPLIVSQDLANGAYSELVERMHEILARHADTVLAYAAGHEHSLQVLRHAPPGRAGPSRSAGGPSYVLVSGSAAKLTGVKYSGDTRFKHSAIGYMRLDVRHRSAQREYWLEVVEIDAPGDGVVDRLLLRSVPRGPGSAASVSASTSDPQRRNDRDTEQIAVVQAFADLSVAVVDEPEPVFAPDSSSKKT